jgi:hypothetical protein
MHVILLFAYWTVPSEMHFRCQVDDVHVDRLVLLVLWRNRAQSVLDFITRQWYILAFDAETINPLYKI